MGVPSPSKVATERMLRRGLPSFAPTLAKEIIMLKGGILWMLGVPGIIVILLLLFGIL